VTTSKWDKISKKLASQYVDQIMYLDTRRDNGNYMAYPLHGLDIYKGVLSDLNRYYDFKYEELEELGRETITYVHDEFYPTLAEVFYQMPLRFAHKVFGFKLNLIKMYRDGVTGDKKVEVVFYRRVTQEVVEEGPLTARAMFIKVIKEAMDPKSEQTGMLQYTSFPDATRDRNQMQWLRERLKEAETMEESQLSDAIASFWLKAFRQR
jgi:hypothetical protein